MIEILNEHIVMVDVDETLILDRDPITDKESLNEFVVNNPYDLENKKRIPHFRHIELIKQMKGRGRYIGVWSGGGVLWAKEVVKALGLESYVDIVMTKPLGYVDDLQADRWLNNHIYLKPEGTDRG